MQTLQTNLNDLSYLWLIFFVMIASGLIKEYKLFTPILSWISSVFKSNRVVIALVSLVGGILPIEGRVTVSAGILDTLPTANKGSRQKLGIVDYLATHHYYMWSPLEKTVILPIAAFGLSYGAWLGLIWPLLTASLLFISAYVWFYLKEDELVIEPSSYSTKDALLCLLPISLTLTAYSYDKGWMAYSFGALAFYYVAVTKQYNLRKLLSYVKWDVILVVAVVIVLGNFFKSHSAYFVDLLKSTGVDPSNLTGLALISAIGFGASFLMGSSGKFVAIAVLMAQLFGEQYFVWFFAVDFAAYLISPTHKCVAIGNKYFGTPITTYYGALASWSVLLLLVAWILTFF